MSALVQLMAWSRPGDKALSEPMLTLFTDVYGVGGVGGGVGRGWRVLGGGGGGGGVN